MQILFLNAVARKIVVSLIEFLWNGVDKCRTDVTLIKWL